MQRLMTTLGTKDDRTEMQQVIAMARHNMASINTCADGLEANTQPFLDESSALKKEVHEKEHAEPTSGGTRRTSTGSTSSSREAIKDGFAPRLDLRFSGNSPDRGLLCLAGFASRLGELWFAAGHRKPCPVLLEHACPSRIAKHRRVRQSVWGMQWVEDGQAMWLAFS